MKNSRKAWVAHQSSDSHYVSTALRIACWLLVVGSTFLSGLMLFAQTSDSPTTTEGNDSWTATTDLNAKNANPTRVIKSHEYNGNHTLDTQSIQVRGFDGHFAPYQDVETEIVQVDRNTVRTITRAFGRDSNGAKKVVQIIEEEKHSLPGGGSNVVRITSIPDSNGKPQPVR